MVKSLSETIEFCDQILIKFDDEIRPLINDGANDVASAEIGGLVSALREVDEEVSEYHISGVFRYRTSLLVLSKKLDCGEELGKRYWAQFDSYRNQFKMRLNVLKKESGSD